MVSDSMSRRAALAANVVIVIVGVLSSAVSPPAAATIRANIAGADGIDVTIVNEDSRAIEAWAFTIVYDTTSRTGTRDEVVTDAYPALVGHSPSSGGPIAPQETRITRLPIRNATRVVSIALTLALYGDLSYQGEVAKRTEVLKQREQDARDLDAWITALSEARRRPEVEKKKYVQDQLAQRRVANGSRANNSFANGLCSTVRDAFASSEANGQSAVLVIDALKAVFEQQRALALRHLAR